MAEAGKSGGKAAAGDDALRLKVFISYSRKDVDFADDLELFLDTRGFEPIVDRHDIDPNEDWRRRLGELIHGCDVVVFVLTATSAGSPVCAWEVEEAARLGKRRLVVVPGDLADGARPPEGLGAANWIHCWRNPAVPGASLANGKKELERALKADVGWLRERTRLMERAAEWAARGAAMDSPHLLRGDVLAEAQAWALRTPKDETIPAGVDRFLAASEAAEAKVKAEAEAGLKEKEAALAKAAQATRRVRRATWIGAGVAAAFLVAAIAAGWIALQMQGEAERQTAEAARRNSDLVVREADGIDATNAHETALLMALMADPSARATPALSRRFPDGFAQARARLVSSYLGDTLERIISTKAGNYGATFSPDGAYVLAASEDGAHVWEAASGKEVLMLKHPDAVRASAYSRDGKLILTGAWDGAVRIWDATSGELLRTFREPPTQTLSARQVSFSADGRRVLVAYTRFAKILDATTGETLAFFRGRGGLTLSAAFSPDETRVVTTSSSAGAEVWEASSGKLLFPLNDTDQFEYEQAAFTPNGAQIVAAVRGGGSTHFFDATTGKWMVDNFFAGSIRTIAFSMDGRFLAGLVQSTPTIWDMKTGRVYMRIKTSEEPMSVTFSPDGRRVVVASKKSIRIYGATHPFRETATVGVGARLIALSPDGRRGFLTPPTTQMGIDEPQSTPRQIGLLWDAEGAKKIASLTGEPGGSIRSAAFSRDGQKLIVGFASGEARVWLAGGGEPAVVITAGGGDVLPVAISPDGDRFATGGDDGLARIWSASDGKLLHVLEGQGGPVVGVAFSPDGRRVLTGVTQRVLEWDADSGKLVRTFAETSDFPVASMVFSPDRRVAAFISTGDRLRLFDTATGALLRAIPGQGAASAVFSQDGRRLFAAGYQPRLWDIETGREVMSAEYAGQQMAAVFVGNDRRMLFEGSDGLVDWPVSAIVTMDAKGQVKSACERLWKIGAPLAFSVADVATYTSLAGEPVDPDNPDMLVSPCRGVLPAEAFAKAGAAQKAPN